MSSPRLSAPPSTRRDAVVLTAVALAVTATGLAWAKWLPYADRATGFAAGGRWKGSSLLTAGSGEDPFARAWTFTTTYGLAVWKALVVALVVAACVDVLVPRRWLLRALGCRSSWGGSVRGGLVALPGMMCTCCSAPLAVTLRRAGVPVPAALAFWLGNPVPNPAVLVFLGLLAPGSWVVVRLVLGTLLVFGFSALVGHLLDRRRTGAAADPPPASDRALAAASEPPVVGREVPGRLVRSFARLAVVLVPEYLVVVFLVGLVGEPLGRVLGHGGVVAVLVAAVVGTVVVLPTGGEIPIVLGLGATVVVALLAGGLLSASG